MKCDAYHTFIININGLSRHYEVAMGEMEYQGSANENYSQGQLFEENRNVTVELSRKVYSYRKTELSKKRPDRVSSSVGTCIKNTYCQYPSFLLLLASFFPPVQWLPEYAWKKCLLPDVLAGLTVGVMAVSEGLAYAKLAGMPPISGLYTNIVSSLMYVLLGTTRQAVFGPLAALSLLSGAIRYKYIPCEDCWQWGNETERLVTADAPDFTPLQLGSTIAFLVGCYLIIAGMLRLSFLTAYLSDQVVGGFTIGIAVHMLSGQLGSIFGIPLPNRRGIGKAVMTFVDLFESIEQTNLVTLTIFLSSVIFLLVTKLLINPRIQSTFKFPIPAELLVIACGTIASYYGQLSSKYAVKIEGNIPAGLPSPKLPRFDLISTLWLDSVFPAIVTYSLSISFGKVFARRNGYKIDPAQEFYAYGALNLIGSFFECINAGQSMARSIVNERSGGKTLISTFVAALVGIFILLFIAPLLESLPACTLSSIVATSCVLILSHITETKDLYRVSKIDLSTYVVTAVCVVALDIAYGLAAGAGWALLTVALRSQRVKVKPMDVESAFLYCMEWKHGKDEKSNHHPDGIEIVEMKSSIFYANADMTKMELLRFGEALNRNYGHGRVSVVGEDVPKTTNCGRKILVLDMAGVPFMDPMGITALKEVKQELQTRGIVILLGGCSDSHFRTLQESNVFGDNSSTLAFPTMQDALSFAVESRDV